MQRYFLLLVVFAITCGTLAFRAGAEDKPDAPPATQGSGRARGPGGPGGGPPPGGVHLIPPFVRDKLDLTDDQEKQIADLEKEATDKLAKILTADQMKTLKETRPPRGPRRGGAGGPPGGGPGGGGPGGGGPGGPGGPNDQPPPPPPPAN